MITTMLAAALTVMLLSPKSVAARVLHRYLVEFPAKVMATLERRHLIFLIAAAMMLTAGDAIIILGSADLAMLAAWDASLYVDLLLAGWTLAAVARTRSVMTACKALLPARLPRTARGSRARRDRVRAERKLPANDDDGPELAVAA